ncbi:MAG: protein kinase, partial [Kofleriaceae bacterium]
MPKVEAEFGSAANSYEILAKLATGGMAEIFLARGNSTAGVERYVVLKRILRNRAHDQAFVRMFLDEARLAAQLQHPNIAQVYDIGKLGDSYFFTMEYVHGETVRLLLQRSHALRSPIPISSVLVVAAGTAAGLHHAHERIGLDGKPLGIVHRDVSPSNLMVSYEGNVKVVDFGVAKAAHRSQETRSGTVKGKISYLSPEQCRGASMDRRSDLFSVGIVLWEMLTLERLYKRNSDFDAMAAIVSDEPAPPSSRRPEIPPELDALVLRLLAKDPDDRYQTADELHEAIETIAVRLGTALSSAALARYIRDLFGQRPEPWVEMQSRETHPEVFTVTSEPVPADLRARPADALENQLGAVPDLSDDATASAGPNDAFAKSPSGAPFHSDSDSSRNERPAWQPPAVQPPSPRTHGATGPQVPMRLHNSTGPQLPQTYPIAGSGGYPQLNRDPSGAHVAPSPSYSNASYPLYVPPPEPPDEKKGLPRGVIIAIAGVVTILIVVVAVLAGGGSKDKQAAGVTPGAAPAVAVAT